MHSTEFIEHLICAKYFLGAALDSGSELINRFMYKSGDDNDKGLKHDKDKNTSLVAQMVKICLQCRRPGIDSWVRKIPWRRKYNPLQHSCLENPMDGGA